MGIQAKVAILGCCYGQHAEHLHGYYPTLAPESIDNTADFCRIYGPEEKTIATHEDNVSHRNETNTSLGLDIRRMVTSRLSKVSIASPTNE